jgi:hypothetical protein
MQIHEITQINEQGIMGGIKQAAQAAVGGVKQAAQAAMGNAGAQAAQNTDMLGKAMFKQWNTKAAQLANAAAATGAGTVPDKEYSAQLMDFVEQNMLQKRSSDLDQTSRQRLGQMIGKVVAARNDPRQLEQAFRDLAKITTTARVDPNAGRGAAAAPGAKTATPGVQSALNPQQAKANAEQFLFQTVGRGQQQGLANYLAGSAAKSTGNPTVDGFLSALGVKVQ